VGPGFSDRGGPQGIEFFCTPFFPLPQGAGGAGSHPFVFFFVSIRGGGRGFSKGRGRRGLFGPFLTRQTPTTFFWGGGGDQVFFGGPFSRCRSFPGLPFRRGGLTPKAGTGGKKRTWGGRTFEFSCFVFCPTLGFHFFGGPTVGGQ